MDVKQAAAAAKKHLSELLADEAIAVPTLEEIWLEPKDDIWYVTLAVRRLPTDTEAASPAGRLGLTRLPDYKVVRISNKDGTALSMRDRLSEVMAK